MTAVACLPDRMGVWDEAGDTIWLPREHYPKRSAAIAFAVREWDVPWTGVRCLARHLRARNDHWYIECSPDHPDAFPVWRLEVAECHYCGAPNGLPDDCEPDCITRFIDRLLARLDALTETPQ